MFGEDIGGLQIGRDQNIGPPGHIGDDPLGLGGGQRHRVIKGQRPVQRAARDLSAFRHLAQRRRGQGRVNIRGDGFDRGQQGDPGVFNLEGVGEVNGVLRNIAHRLKRGRDIDRRVAHQQRPRIGRHIEGKHMTDPPLGADPVFLVQHRPHELAGIQAALHQGLDPALARQLDRLFRGLVTVFHIHHGITADIDRMFIGELVDPGFRPDQ